MPQTRLPVTLSGTSVYRRNSLLGEITLKSEFLMILNAVMAHLIITDAVSGESLILTVTDPNVVERLSDFDLKMVKAATGAD